MSAEPVPPRHFRDDLVTIAAVLLMLAVFFAPTVGYIIFGESGLS